MNDALTGTTLLGDVVFGSYAAYSLLVVFACLLVLFWFDCLFDGLLACLFAYLPVLFVLFWLVWLFVLVVCLLAFWLVCLLACLCRVVLFVLFWLVWLCVWLFSLFVFFLGGWLAVS